MMRKLLTYTLVVAMTATSFALNAQDVQFSQPYSTPQFLNPAFSGFGGGTRISSNYRNQWPGIENNYQAFGAGADFYVKEVNGGIGVSFLRDVAGVHKLSNTSISLQYSQHLAISRTSSLALGVQAGFGQRQFDDSKLLFADQVINSTSTSQDAQNLNPANHFGDLSAGIMYYRDDFWAGASLHHLNQPNQSLMGEIDRLPVKFSLHAGWVLPISSLEAKPGNRKVRILANYKSQGKWDQLDLGGMYTLYGINLGLWYRGIPLKPYEPGYQNNESIVMLLGYEFKNGLGIGYSYDLTLSRLYGHSGGAHEIAVFFELNQRRKKLRKRIVPCAKF